MLIEKYNCTWPGFEIFQIFCSAFNTTCLVPTAPSVLDGSVEKAEVTGLYPWMEYQFRIIATNEYGPGEASIPSLKIKTWDAGKRRIQTFIIFYFISKSGSNNLFSS